ncbi:MAG: SDR family NAD(P)-dependent oxidoreductase [Desulfosudis oleivorans]|nr:SDR family NAD(P)-dependent oxidoreductase [Desulfosudis oleivorans]
MTGSGRGIGKATALRFAREGARVVVSDLDEAPAQETAQEIRTAGGEAVVYAGDVARAGFAEGIVEKAAKTWGGLHILVNNAGFTWDAVVHKMTDEQWETMLAVHLTAPFRIIRAAAPYFREAAKQEKAAGKAVNRKIINVSSLAGMRGNSGQANYASAKAGVVGLARALAKEWGPLNVQVNAVSYGWDRHAAHQGKRGRADHRTGREGHCHRHSRRDEKHYAAPDSAGAGGDPRRGRRPHSVPGLALVRLCLRPMP